MGQVRPELGSKFAATNRNRGENSPGPVRAPPEGVPNPSAQVPAQSRHRAGPGKNENRFRAAHEATKGVFPSSNGFKIDVARPPKPISKSGVFDESYCNIRPLERCPNFRNMQKCPFRVDGKRLFEKLSFGMVGQSASSGRPSRPGRKKTRTPLGRNQRKFPSPKK